MLFKRKGRSKFVCDPFTIIRPSGRTLGREALDLFTADGDYNVRTEDNRVWLMDGEREVAFAEGEGAQWTILLGKSSLRMEQPKVGVAHTLFYLGDELIAQSRAAGPLDRVAELYGGDRFAEDQRAFLVAISLVGWREGERGLFSALNRQPVDEPIDETSSTA